MKTSTFPTYVAKYERLADRYDVMLSLFRSLIATQRILRNIKENVDGTYSLPDYLLLCLTKAAKSLHSIGVLVGLPYRHGEDALILTRAVYECYLQISYLLAAPSRINNLVAGRVSLSSGRLARHKTKIVDATTKAEVAEIVRISQMATETRWEDDKDVHTFLYPFLCSYSHMDIACLDSYRDGYRLSMQSPHKIFQAGLYSFYCGCLILHEFLRFNSLSRGSRVRMASFLRGSSRLMGSILADMTTPDGGKDVPARFKKRIAALGQLKT